MKKLAFIALAAVAMSGCDFAGGSGSDSLPLAGLQVANLPQTNAGVAWDADGNPDVIVEIQNAAGRAVYRSEIHQDFDISQPFSVAVTEAVEIPFSTVQMTVAVYDVDSGLQDSEIMARSSRFSAEDLAATPELALQAQSGETTFSVQRTAAAPAGE
ncbi:MAG: hypothetical protein K8H90_03915 [Thermoanaerobaculia bacterium]|nr:hypothetical protein [Thermoanaerobaculia bacterium]